MGRIIVSENMQKEAECMWNSVQCAVQGRGHIKSDIPCQDKTFHVHANGVDVIALADGAGSARLSHYGAEFVTKQICELLGKQFDIYYGESDGVTIKRVIIGCLMEGLEKLAMELECEMKDLSSTLLVAAVHNDKYIVIHIGDGVIGYVKNDELKIASHPENGEFVNTTVFVTSKDALPTMKLIKGKHEGITGFALMSDGTETSLYNKKEKSLASGLKKIMDLSQYMDRVCLQNEIERSFEKVIKNATMDDCSLILLIEENYNFPGYNQLTLEEKRQLFHLKESVNYRRRLKRYDEILKYACLPRTVSQISKRLYLKKKHCYKHIDFLISKNLLVTKNGLIWTSIIMDK